MKPDLIVNSVDPDRLASLIRIHNVFNATCELVIIYQNMICRIVFTLYILYLSKDK